MAAGDKALLSWIQGIYDSFNNVISKYSNGLTQLGSPATKISASDITTLNSKINQIKSDYYLSTEPSLFVTYSASAGNLITTNFKTTADDNVSGFAVLKCKNIATNSHGKNSHGTNNHGYKSNGTNSHTSKDNGTCSSNGTWNPRGSTKNSRSGYSSNSTVKNGQGSSNGNGSKSNGSYSDGTNGHGTCTTNGACTAHTVCSSNTICQHGTVIQLRNVNTTNG